MRLESQNVREGRTLEVTWDTPHPSHFLRATHILHTMQLKSKEKWAHSLSNCALKINYAANL